MCDTSSVEDSIYGRYYVRRPETTDPGKAWMFTIFKDVYDNYANLQIVMYTMRKSIVHMRLQLERCPTSRRVHIQGYVRFHDIHTKNQVKDFLGCRSAHVGNRIGRHAQALRYVAKSFTGLVGTRVEYRDEEYHQWAKQMMKHHHEEPQ